MFNKITLHYLNFSYEYDYPRSDSLLRNSKREELETKRRPAILCNFEGETFAKNELGLLTRLIRPEKFEKNQEQIQEPHQKRR